MRSELRCERARVELSARLDGETDEATARALDAHLATCPGCRAHEEALAAARRALRTQPAGRVPDLSGAIMERIEPRAAPLERRREWLARARFAGIGAVASALLLLGASLPGTKRPPDLAAASAIAQRVRAAAGDLRAYQATYVMVERGWHPEVSQRRLVAKVAYSAPESFRLRVRDRSRYPASGPWPRNDVDVVANPRRWWLREPTSCPVDALPGCAVPPGIEERTIVDRQPFDGTSRLPTDIVVPLETLASSQGFEVLGTTELLGRRVYRLALAYREAAPLVAALEVGGSWRGFRPSDRVEVWIDRRTWFPLRFEVTRGGLRLLRVSATSFAAPDRLDPAQFAPPVAGVVTDGGFTPRPLESLPGPAPAHLAGLEPHRAGVTDEGQVIRSYAAGMTWLKVTVDRSGTRPDIYDAAAEQVRLDSGGFGYYQPAAESPYTDAARRRVDLHGRRVHVHLESNLARAALIEVAGSLGIRGRRMPPVRREGGLEVRRLDPRRASRVWFALTPAYLPAGYRPSAAFLTVSADGRRTVTVHYRQAEATYDGVGIRITQSRPLRLPPTSETFQAISMGDLSARWSAERGELEWTEDGTYRAVAAPSLGLDTAARIARGLR